MKHVYGYIRVSDPKQGKGVSLQEQKEAIIRYASTHNLTIIQWFKEKKTAAKQGRPLFSQMLDLLFAKKAEGVIFHKIDRSARNHMDWSAIHQLLTKNVEVHFAHEGIDLSSRSSILTADIQAVIAADFIRNLRDETIKGQDGRLKQGFYPWGAPLGYKDMGRAQHKQINPIQGPLVKKLYELYSSKKYTLKDLTSLMYELGLRSKKGNKVSLNSIARILKNPFYMGIIKIRDKTYLGGHEPIISTQLFKKVQNVFATKSNTKACKHNYTYRRRIKCMHCDYSLIAEKQKGNVYYRCQRKECPTKTLREDVFEDYLLKSFKTLELQDEEAEKLRKAIDAMEQFQNREFEQQRKTLKLQLGNVKARLDRLTDTLLDGIIGNEIYASKKEELLVKQRNLEEKIELLEDNNNTIFEKARTFLELAKNVVNTYDSGILEEKRDLIETIVSNCTSDGKKVSISMVSPFTELSQRVLLSGCDLNRSVPRTETLTYCSIKTSPILPGKPLTETQIQLLAKAIVQSIASLPCNN